MSIRENIEAVREKIAEEEKAAGRDPSSIALWGQKMNDARCGRHCRGSTRGETGSGMTENWRERYERPLYFIPLRTG